MKFGSISGWVGLGLGVLNPQPLTQGFRVHVGCARSGPSEAELIGLRVSFSNFPFRVECNFRLRVQ